MSKLDPLLTRIEDTISSLEGQTEPDFADQVLLGSLRQNRLQLLEDMQESDIIEWEDEPNP